MSPSALTWFAAAALGVTAVGGGLFASAVSQPDVARPAATMSATAQSGGEDTTPILVPAGPASGSAPADGTPASSITAVPRSAGVDDKGGERDRDSRLEVGDDRDSPRDADGSKDRRDHRDDDGDDDRDDDGDDHRDDDHGDDDDRDDD